MTAENTSKEDLLNSEEFNKAIEEAANLKKEIVTSCKDRNKNNYDRFLDIMIRSDREIEEIIQKKVRNRTDAEKEKFREWKKDVSQTYRQTCDLITPEVLEDGELSKVQKIVQKVSKVVKMMDFIGNNEIDKEFEKYGISLKYDRLSTNPTFQNETIKQSINDIFRNGREIREEINGNTDDIKENIYTRCVPVDLQYDKQTNPTGFKSSDFTKLVDIQAKVLMASTDDDRDKIEERVTTLAGDLTFQNKKNDMLSKKMMDMIPSEEQ